MTRGIALLSPQANILGGAMFITLLFILISLTPNLAWSIDHQLEVESAQDWANSFQTPYPILVFDRDHLNYLFAKNQLQGDDNEGARLQFLGEYVERRIGFPLERNDLVNIDIYLTQTTGMAAALPLFEGHGSEKRYKMCSVFSLPPNGNAKVESERVTGLNINEAFEHSHQSFENLSKTMDFESLYLFSLYHEVSHCLDQKYLPESHASQSSHAVHLSEAFAEVMAYLKLTERLDPNVVEARALYRTLYSRNVGVFLAQNQMGNAFNPHYTRGGVIYYLTPYLMGAYEKLVFELKTVDFHNDPQLLLKLAEEIVENNKLSGRGFSAIGMALQEGFPKIMQRYQDYAFESPDFFYKSYLELMEYKNQTELWNQKAFKETLEEAPSLLAPPLPLAELCETLSGEPWQYFETLNVYREIFNSGLYEVESNNQAYEDLNQVSAILQKECGV